MASRIQSLGITLQTNTSVSPKSLVSGGNRQHLMEHCPGSPSPLLQALGGTKKQKNWRETERGEAERSVKEERERDSTRWIMQSCQRRLLLEVLAVLKRASPDLHKLHLLLSPLPVAESRLICPPANGQQQDEGVWGELRGQPGHLVTGELSWRDTLGTTSTLFIIIIYRGHQQGDLSWYVQPPCGNIITGQRLGE